MRPLGPGTGHSVALSSAAACKSCQPHCRCYEKGYVLHSLPETVNCLHSLHPCVSLSHCAAGTSEWREHLWCHSPAHSQLKDLGALCAGCVAFPPRPPIVRWSAWRRRHRHGKLEPATAGGADSPCSSKALSSCPWSAEACQRAPRSCSSTSTTTTTSGKNEIKLSGRMSATHTTCHTIHRAILHTPLQT
jgi:hypothetical protein